MNYWETIADNLCKAGWSWGCITTIDSRGRTIWITDAHRDDGKRFIVRVAAYTAPGNGLPDIKLELLPGRIKKLQ